MTSGLIRWSLRHAWVVTGLALVGLVYGLYVLVHARYDVFPEFVPPQAVVQTEAPGLVAEQVEQLVTRPLEQAISGAAGVESVRSESIQGLSVITVTFAEGTDPYRDRQVIAEKLSETAGGLPAGVETPKLEPLTSSTMDLLKIGFLSEKLSPLELRDLVQWTVRPRLLAVPGVSRATLYGGEVRQLQVQADPDALAARGLALADLVAAVEEATGVRGGGFVDTDNQRVLIETRGQVRTPAELAEAVVAVREGLPIRLREVARVVAAGEPKFGDALLQGREGVLLSLSSQYGANTLDVTRATEQALAELMPTLRARGIEVLPALHRPANFIETALAGVRDDLLIGALLIALVLFLFLRDPRSVLVSFLTIPLSLLAAIVAIDAIGWTVNTMTLGGLAVALGVVVDDAIIDVENIVRRLRAGHAPGREELVELIHRAAFEVRAPVVYATLVVALVLVPVLLLGGLQGKFFAPLATAFIVATLASLLVALTVTPALALLMLSRARLAPEPGWLGRLKARHTRWLAALAEHPRAVLVSALLVAALSIGALPFFGSELIPPFREGHFVVQVVAPPGTSLAAMRRTGARISAELLALPGLRTASEQIGRAEAGEDTWGPNRSEFHIEIDPLPGAAEERLQQRIRGVLAGYPGLQTEVLTFLGDRISESLSGEASPVAIGVYGDDLDALDVVAARVAAVLRTVPGAADVQLKSPPGLPLVEVDLDPRALSLNGFRAVEVLDAVQTAYQGKVAAQAYEGQRIVDLAVVLPPERRRDPEALGELLVRSASGRMLPLRELARIVPGEGRSTVLHDAGRRRQVVTVNPSTRDIEGFVARARRAIDTSLKLPAGIYLEWSGAASDEAAARRQLALHTAVAAIGIVLLLLLAFPDARSAFLIVATTPFALVGGVAIAAATGGNLSIGSLVGFVTLFGIATRNAILLVAHVEQLVRDEGEPWSFAVVLRATRERLVPILMTALVSALGLVPLAISNGEAGREVQGPMAQVILGGLATSTALNLLLLPLLVHRFWRPLPAWTRAAGGARLAAGVIRRRADILAATLFPQERQRMGGIYKAYDIRGIYPTEIDETIARQVGQAFRAVLDDEDFAHGGDKVVVSRDMRPSSVPLAAALIEG